MTKQSTAFRKIMTDQEPEVVLLAAEDALRRVGGVLFRQGDSIQIQGGNSGINNAFATDITATATVFSRGNGEYEITCQITAAPNTTFWVCGVFGLLCVWPPLIVPVFHFMVDPLPVYQRALDQISIRAVPPPQPVT